MNNCQAGTSELFQVEIPMFYRVTMYTNEMPYDMAYIPGGTFSMGENGTNAHENWYYCSPAHAVTVDSFWMAQTEVSWTEWETIYNWATNNGYEFDNAGTNSAPDHPVCNINWFDAVKWCNAKSEYEGRTPAYYEGNVFTPNIMRTGQFDITYFYVNWNEGYRLPTEAEWEYAARGALVSNRFPWGNTISYKQAAYQSTGVHDCDSFDLGKGQGVNPAFAFGSPPYSGPVTCFGQNGYGLYNMAGNVAEWCYDQFDYDGYTNAPQTNPYGPETGYDRIVRGGGYQSESAASCEVFWREYANPNHHDWQVTTYMDIGFRYVLRKP